MYLTNGSFHCDFDADYINYLLLFGNQAGFMAGLNPNITSQKVAAARKRGLKVVAVDPICNHAAAKADDADVIDLPRLVIDFNRRNFGRLRSLIDAINGF